jgi:hypothetical protein
MSNKNKNKKWDRKKNKNKVVNQKILIYNKINRLNQEELIYNQPKVVQGKKVQNKVRKD